MSLKLKYALLFALASTTSLSGYASNSPNSIPTTHGNVNNKIDVNKGIQSVKSAYPKAAKAENWPVVPMPVGKIFVPFTAKRVLITFDNELETLPGLDQEYIGKKITTDTIMEINNKIVDYYIANDYLLPQIDIDKDAMLSGILTLKLGLLTK